MRTRTSCIGIDDWPNINKALYTWWEDNTNSCDDVLYSFVSKHAQFWSLDFFFFKRTNTVLIETPKIACFVIVRETFSGLSLYIILHELYWSALESGVSMIRLLDNCSGSGIFHLDFLIVCSSHKKDRIWDYRWTKRFQTKSKLASILYFGGKQETRATAHIGRPKN